MLLGCPLLLIRSKEEEIQGPKHGSSQGYMFALIRSTYEIPRSMDGYTVI